MFLISPYVLNISRICSLVTFLVKRPTWILVGRGVTERSLRRLFEDPERDRRLRISLLGLSGESLACLFSLSLSRSALRRSFRSFDLGRVVLVSFGGSLTGLALLDRDRVTVLRFVRDRSAPLLEDDEELEEEELLLDELDRDPELLLEELLSDELPLLSLLLELRFLRSFSRPRCFFSALSESADSDRFFERAIPLFPENLV